MTRIRYYGPETEESLKWKEAAIQNEEAIPGGRSTAFLCLAAKTPESKERLHLFAPNEGKEQPYVWWWERGLGNATPADHADRALASWLLYWMSREVEIELPDDPGVYFEHIPGEEE